MTSPFNRAITAFQAHTLLLFAFCVALIEIAFFAFIAELTLSSFLFTAPALALLGAIETFLILCVRQARRPLPETPSYLCKRIEWIAALVALFIAFALALAFLGRYNAPLSVILLSILFALVLSWAIPWRFFFRKSGESVQYYGKEKGGATT